MALSGRTVRSAVQAAPRGNASNRRCFALPWSSTAVASVASYASGAQVWRPRRRCWFEVAGSCVGDSLAVGEGRREQRRAKPLRDRGEVSAMPHSSGGGALYNMPVDSDVLSARFRGPTVRRSPLRYSGASPVASSQSRRSSSAASRAGRMNGGVVGAMCPSDASNGRWVEAEEDMRVVANTAPVGTAAEAPCQNSRVWRSPQALLLLVGRRFGAAKGRASGERRALGVRGMSRHNMAVDADTLRQGAARRRGISCTARPLAATCRSLLR